MELSALSRQQVESVHRGTLRILSEIGILLTHRPARELLADAGAGLQGDRVLLPPELVEASVGRCPGRVVLRGRRGDPMVLGDGDLHWHNLGGAHCVFDPAARMRRPATVQDVRDSTRLLDALSAATSITPFFTPQDVPGHAMALAMYRHTLPWTVKPVQGPGVQNRTEVKFAVGMAAVLGKPAETLSLAVSPISPLTFPDDAVEAIIEIAHEGIPFTPLPCPTAGTTAPMSLAGSLAQQNAEVLACIVLAQLVRPGLPIVYCGRLAMMEPRTGLSVWGGVEVGLASAATVQIGHRYGLPVNVYGLSTNSVGLDIQNGYERALNAIIPALAGADELSGIGEMEAGVMGAYAQMVCDDEIASSICRLVRGFSVDDDALGVSVIAAAMEGTRNFLDQRHTVRYLRSGELMVTRLALRGGWETWLKGGMEGMAQRAQAEADRILAEHQVPPLSAEQEYELDQLLAAAQSELMNEPG